MKHLVGSGDKIFLAALPVAVAGVAANVRWPAAFEVGGPSSAVRAVSIATLIAGLVCWGWSVALILTDVPRGALITRGPYAVVKHPLYTGVALLVIPAVGLLLNTWVGVVIGIAMYLASRRFAPEEEAALSASFGAAWDRYCDAVKLPWL